MYRYLALSLSLGFHLALVALFFEPTPYAGLQVSGTIIEIKPVRLERTRSSDTSRKLPAPRRETPLHVKKEQAVRPAAPPAADPADGAAGSGLSGETPVAEYAVSQMPRLKHEVRVPYPERALKERIEGPVVLDFVVDSSGRVRDVTVIDGPSEDLKRAAHDAATRFEFEPARVHDTAVAVRIRYAYRFVLNR